MSLITDPLLLKLWELAQAQTTDKGALRKLWTHLWTKHLFSEPEWLVSQEPPPEGTHRRRGDVTIEFLGGENQGTVLGFHEAEGTDIEEGENQAFDACMRYLGEHPDMELVYAFTSFGTKGRAWECCRGDTYLRPLF